VLDGAGHWRHVGAQLCLAQGELGGVDMVASATGEFRVP
jgi:hypothetical protein